MSATIDYFLTTVSPFTYLGNRLLAEIAARQGRSVNVRPFSLVGVWEKSGSVPLSQRSEARQRYRLVELQRIALFRNLPLTLKPKHFPVNPERADLCVTALSLAGKDALGAVQAFGEAIWVNEQDISDENVIASILKGLGHDASLVLAESARPEVVEQRQQNTRAAIEASAIGSPCYVYKGETFWGQDRLEMLEAMIASGRDAFHAV
ncbi:MAG: 2-hydroxychromene-2-carboxylate isomerase [Rhizobiaceae bacterium]